jgi:hypothetical protein
MTADTAGYGVIANRSLYDMPEPSLSERDSLRGLFSEDAVTIGTARAPRREAGGELAAPLS